MNYTFECTNFRLIYSTKRIKECGITKGASFILFSFNFYAKHDFDRANSMITQVFATHNIHGVNLNPLLECLTTHLS